MREDSFVPLRGTRQLSLPMSTRRKLPLLDVDPDLGVLVPVERREAARRELDVEVYRLTQGPWSAGGEDSNPQHVGLLLVDGVISREVVVSDTVSTELLGPGDVVRPWSIQEPAGLLQLTVRWNALTESRVAVLDRRFAVQLGRWPEVNAALIDRVNERAQRIATTQAICQLNRVDRRLLSLFWHLAERWGRITPDGVAIPLTLSHRMLGQLVGARRPTVSTAIGELAERDELVRRNDGTWLLKGEPVGMPTADTERVVPIRRRLFGRLPVEGDEVPPVLAGAEPVTIPAAANGEEVAAPERAAITAGAELRETVARLRNESALHISQLEELTAEARRLKEIAITAREERARRRAQRDPAVA
jgi:CRP/FNR family cyclic AMP-dependent transcriptional regulator